MLTVQLSRSMVEMLEAAIGLAMSNCRSPTFQHNNSKLFLRRAKIPRHHECDKSSQCYCSSNHNHSASKAVRVTEQPNHIRPEKAAEITHRINQSNSCGCRALAQD